MFYKTDHEFVCAVRKDNALLAIISDDTPMSFEDINPSGTLVSWHRDYRFGHEQPTCRPLEYMQALAETVNEDAADNVAYPDEDGIPRASVDMMADYIAIAEADNIILPVYMLEHSGICLSVAPFNDPWDSGWLGFYYISNTDAQKKLGFDPKTEDGRKKIKEHLAEDIAAYSSILRGDVYGFQLYLDGEEEDSCWGFVGDIDTIASSIKEYLPEDLADMADDLAWYLNDADEYFDTIFD